MIVKKDWHCRLDSFPEDVYFIKFVQVYQAEHFLTIELFYLESTILKRWW